MAPFPMSSSQPSTPTLPKDEGQLFGGPHDGRDILLPLTAGEPPPAVRHAGLLYLRDGRLSDGRPRYSRPRQQWPFPPPPP